MLDPRQKLSQMFIIIIIILITQQPEQDRLAENQLTAGLSSLNEYENGMRKSETELHTMCDLVTRYVLTCNLLCDHKRTLFVFGGHRTHRAFVQAHIGTPD